ncbi:uncharacterized protein N7458_004994 [Penicillium daleae]|uniref:Ras-GEF domain-containing protein n=1 Tax=Penicillium daleae TaxID=63821 RepID=A0AAD6C7D2_9EURO|nr:uncharacterized protein N7458_004994 [Penicillium daleae]KAJ5454038.1 hypothetical protein N7458_004994 [Penicillium daleae]
MADRAPQVPAIRHSIFEVPWPMVDLEVTRQLEDADLSSDNDGFPSARHCRKVSLKDSPVSWKIFSKHEDTGAITMQLLRESWNMFKGLGLRDWADDVLGMPSTKMKIFRLYYSRLAFSLFSFLRQVPDEITTYDSIVSTIRTHDRLLYASLLHGLTHAKDRSPYPALTLDTSPITTPVKDLLSNPTNDIICQFGVLETRYQRYCRSIDLANGSYFRTATALLTLVIDQSVVSGSRILTRDILRSFRQISLEGVWNDDCHLKALARRWSCLCHEAEEIAASGRLNTKLLGLAQDLYNHRDFFSLTAILRGLSNGGVGLEPVLSAFLDDSRNYRQYRLNLHKEPCLPFIYPFIKDLKLGNHKAVQGIFGFLCYDQIFTQAM